MKKIIKGDYLLGIRHWAQWYTERIPRFDIFTYLGRNDETGFYFFMSTSKISPFIIYKKRDQINSDGFFPFLINFERIRKGEDKK